MHVDRNHGSLFVIKGLCASACYLAVQHAMEKGERVTVLPGAVLMHHDPTPLTE